MRFFLLSLFFYTAYSLGCEVEYIESIPFYSESCSINITNGKKSDELLLQIKFSTKNQNSIVATLEKLKSALPHNVAAQRINNGYRLFVGPVNQRQIRNAKILLSQVGYNEVVLKLMPLPEVKAELHSFSYKPLGGIGSTFFYMPITMTMSPIVSNYNQALQVCRALGNNTRIAKWDEYGSILLSDAVSLDDVAVPFWLSSKSVVTRFDHSISKRPSNKTINYKVICALNVP